VNDLLLSKPRGCRSGIFQKVSTSHASRYSEKTP